MASNTQDIFQVEKNYRQQDDAESGDQNKFVEKEFFSNTHIRHAFIRKVSMIVLLQLAITAGIIVLFMQVETLRLCAQTNLWIIGGPLLGAILNALIILYVRKNFPWNGILLGLFTLLLSTSIGAGSTLTTPEAVLTAVGITTLIVLSITLLAFQTKIDITEENNALMLCFIFLFLLGLGLGLAALFVENLDRSYLVGVPCLMVFTCLLFCSMIFLIGGKHKSSFSPEDYILAAFLIYMVILF